MLCGPGRWRCAERIVKKGMLGLRRTLLRLLLLLLPPHLCLLLQGRTMRLHLLPLLLWLLQRWLLCVHHGC